MNYVQHTRAAHERLRHQSEARPHHVALYWALFFAWNAARFPAALPLDRDELMSAAHIGNKDTLTATLRALETFGLLSYQPSRSAGSSRVVMANYGGQVAPEVGEQNPAGYPRSGVTEIPEITPEVGQPHTPQVGQSKPEVTPEVGQHSLLVKTVSVNSRVNVGGCTEKKIGEVFSGEGFSSAQVLDNTPDAEQPPPGAAPKTSRIKANQVAPKKKGVWEATIGAATTANPAEPRRRGGGRPQHPEMPFADSELATYEAFAAAFAGTDYELADLRFYHEKILNWRQKGEVPSRRDWKATATQFFLNDAHDNRLKLAPSVVRHEPGTSSSTFGNTGIPTTGYRSKRWD